MSEKHVITLNETQPTGKHPKKGVLRRIWENFYKRYKPDEKMEEYVDGYVDEQKGKGRNAIAQATKTEIEAIAKIQELEQNNDKLIQEQELISNQHEEKVYELKNQRLKILIDKAEELKGMGINIKGHIEDILDNEYIYPIDKGIEELPLSVRTYNALKSANIKTIGELANREESELLKYRNVGKKAILDIKQALNMHGMSLKE